jgi:hypothetical protein
MSFVSTTIRERTLELKSHLKSRSFRNPAIVAVLACGPKRPSVCCARRQRLPARGREEDSSSKTSACSPQALRSFARSARSLHDVNNNQRRGPPDAAKLDSTVLNPNKASARAAPVLASRYAGLAWVCARCWGIDSDGGRGANFNAQASRV